MFRVKGRQAQTEESERRKQSVCTCDLCNIASVKPHQYLPCVCVCMCVCACMAFSSLSLSHSVCTVASDEDKTSQCLLFVPVMRETCERCERRTDKKLAEGQCEPLE